MTHVRAGRWGIVAAAGLLAAALWLRTDAVAALAMATVGSFAVAALAWRWRRTPAALTCALLLVAVSVAGWTDVGRRSRLDRKSTRLNSSHSQQSRMPSSA